MVNMLDCKLKLQLIYYSHFQTNTPGKGMNLLISTSTIG